MTDAAGKTRNILLVGVGGQGTILASKVLSEGLVRNNVISPTIQSKRIELSPLMVLMAVTIGLYMFGMVGGIISIPIAGCAKVLATEYIKVERREEPAAKPTKLARLLKRVRREKSKPGAAKSETEA